MVQDKGLKTILAIFMVVMMLAVLVGGAFWLGVIPQTIAGKPTVGGGGNVNVNVSSTTGKEAYVTTKVYDFANDDKNTQLTAGTGLYYTVNGQLTGNNQTLTSTYTINANVKDEVCAWFFNSTYNGNPKPVCITVVTPNADQIIIPTFKMLAATTDLRVRFYGNSTLGGDQVTRDNTSTSGGQMRIKSLELMLNANNEAWAYSGIVIDLNATSNYTGGGDVLISSPATYVNGVSGFRAARDISNSLGAPSSVDVSKNVMRPIRLASTTDITYNSAPIMMLKGDTLTFPGITFQLASGKTAAFGNTGERVTFYLLDSGPFVKQNNNEIGYGVESDAPTPIDTGYQDITTSFTLG